MNIWTIFFIGFVGGAVGASVFCWPVIKMYLKNQENLSGK